MRPFDITVQELKEKKVAGEKYTLIDVREPAEYEIANLGGRLIPLSVLPKHLDELEADEEIIVHCKMGGRSTMAVEFLRRNGFPGARNLRGGIIEWSDKIDSTIPKY